MPQNTHCTVWVAVDIRPVDGHVLLVCVGKSCGKGEHRIQTYAALRIVCLERLAERASCLDRGRILRYSRAVDILAQSIKLGTDGVGGSSNEWIDGVSRSQ